MDTLTLYSPNSDHVPVIAGVDVNDSINSGSPRSVDSWESKIGALY